MKNKAIKLSLISIFSAVIVGCGGGGGGSPTITFPSNAVFAPANASNAQKVGEIATNNSIPGVGINNVSANGAEVNAGKITHSLTNSFIQRIQVIQSNNYALNAVSETIPCDISGNAIATGNIDGNNYNVVITFNVCRDYGEVSPTSGVISASGTLENDEIKTAFIVVTTELRAGNDVVNVGSRFNITFSVAGSEDEDIIIDITTTGTESGDIYGLQGVRFITKSLANNDLSIYQTKGRIYINDLSAYVEYDASYDMSATPFVYSASDGQVNDGGIARYIANNNDTLTVRAEGGVVNVYKNDETNPIATLN